jgi:hypothetical protein
VQCRVFVWNPLKRPVSFPFGSSCIDFCLYQIADPYFTHRRTSMGWSYEPSIRTTWMGCVDAICFCVCAYHQQILKWSFVADRGPSTSLSRQLLERIESNFSGTILFLDRINMETIRYSHIRTM